MGKEFLPIFLDFNETTQDLSDEQCGRLIRAVVDYANGKDREIGGMELMAFRFLKGTIDRNARLSAVRSEAGSKGGRPKANESKTNQTKPNESKEKQNAINKDNDINNDKDIDIKNQPLLSDDDAFDIQHEHDRVFLAAEDSGFKMSNTVRTRLIALYADYGLEKMLAGFMECATHGVPTLAYLEAVLKGTGKKKPTVKVLPSQAFPQRDYSQVDGDMMDSLAKEIAAMKAGEAG
jgi:hypothetical protein